MKAASQFPSGVLTVGHEFTVKPAAFSPDGTRIAGEIAREPRVDHATDLRVFVHDRNPQSLSQSDARQRARDSVIVRCVLTAIMHEALMNVPG
jgi:hypothetical protein